MFFSVRHKITLAYSLLFVLIFSGLGLWLSAGFSQRYESNIENSLINEARLLAVFVDFADNEALSQFANRAGVELDVRVTVVDRHGLPLAETARPVGELESHFDRPEIQTALGGEVGVERRFSTTVGADLLYVAVPVSNGETTGVLRLSRSLKDIALATRNIRYLILAGTLIGLSVTGLMGWLMAKVVTQPLATLTRKARDFEQGQFHDRREISANDELGELEQVFDFMAASIIHNMDKQVKERAQVEQILRYLPVGVLVVSDQGFLAAANDAAQEILGGITAETGKPLIHLTRNWQINQFVKSLRDGSNSKVQEFVLDNDVRRYIRMQGAALESEDRKELVVVLQDVTDFHLLEQQRRDLVANVSHELRTPLTVIQGFAETLLEEEVDEGTRRHFVDIIRQESLRLSRLLNDLLNLSRLESKGKRKQGYCLLDDVSLKVTEMLTDLAAARGKALHVDVPKDLALAVESDFVEQVLLNYIDNAIKYTPEGTEIRVSADVQDNGFARVVVMDNGPGIPYQEQNRLFERFFRVERSRGREEGGTGLGLAIVKHIVEGFGGQVGVVSHPGSGTSFWATLPIRKNE